MRIGVPKEVKVGEGRVALTPTGVRELVARGHDVVVESGAGLGSRLPDEAYVAEGARIAATPDEVFEVAELIVKVKEPQPEEVARLTPGHTLFTYLHLAADPDLARRLCASGATCIAYETVEDEQGRLPLLTPMSEIAGKLAAQVGFTALLHSSGGRGVLPGGVPGVAPATMLVIGGGVAGTCAAHVALGMGARVTVLDRSPQRLRQLDLELSGRAETRFASDLEIEHLLPKADVVVGTVLVKGARAPRIVRREHLALMREGTVLVDVSIDQGGCFETSRPTSHAEPTYVVDGVLHYCVTNMPGAVPVTSTLALTNATLSYVIALAELGVDAALEWSDLAAGLNVAHGRVVHPIVAAAVDLPAPPVAA